MATPRPLSPHWFHMLLALADDDRHGQGIMEAVLDETQGRIRLWPTMLYRNLDQLCDAGLVAELPRAPTSIAGSPRFFRITARGRRACAAEAERLAAVVATARSKRILRKT
jgi:DNA-binding PadR family transcriptional regulator